MSKRRVTTEQPTSAHVAACVPPGIGLAIDLPDLDTWGFVFTNERNRETIYQTDDPGEALALAEGS